MILDQIVQASQMRAHTLTGQDGPILGSLERNHSNRLSSAIKQINGRTAVIAEMKPASPSRGHLRTIADPVHTAHDLINGGCCALSVITEPDFFHGSIDTIPLIRPHVPVPILRKDFIVDIRQIKETRHAGADAVLLIAAVLQDSLDEFVRETYRQGLEPLVEVHDRKEIRGVLDTGAELIGINNRNLKTLTTNLSTTIHLAPLIKQAGRTVVSESGVTWPCDIRTLRSFVDAFLIGSSIMASEHPRRKLEGFVYA